jgi:molecular chaperone GrpE
MPDQPTSGLPERIAENRRQGLTPERIEAVLNDFRIWLHDAARKEGEAEPEPTPTESIDLHTLLGQFIALRHEVNLQTKAVRAQQEQNAQTLAALQQSLETSQQVRSSAPSTGDDATRAHLKTLVELYDALALAEREAQRVRETTLQALERLAASPALDELASAEPSLLARLFGGAREAATLRESLRAERQWHEDARQAATRVRGLFDSLVTGYTMSLQRLERALRQNELEPIPCVGMPFDPERMEALEIVAASDRPSGEVIDEVRRGYLWRGRVFRPAQVRVAKVK